MKKNGTETYQLGLLVLIVVLLVTNVGLFLRLERTQKQLLGTVRSLAARSSEPQALQALPAGTTAPAFRLAAVGGGEVALEELRGESVLLIFSSTTCPACEQAYPAFEAFHRAHPEQKLLMISKGATAENRALVEAEGFAFPVLAWEDAVASAYQIPGTPFAVAIDASGRVVGSALANSAEALEELLQG